MPVSKHPALQSWEILNDVLRTADEELCDVLMRCEVAGRRRHTFLRRINSRLRALKSVQAKEDFERWLSELPEASND